MLKNVKSENRKVQILKTKSTNFNNSLNTI